MRPETIAFLENIPVRAFVGDIAAYPYHWHKAMEIIYVLEGSAFVSMGSETHLLREDNIAVINTDELHAIHKNVENNKLLILQIDSDFCERINLDFKDTFFYCCSPYHEAEAPDKYNTLKGHIAHLVYLLNEKPGKNQKEDVNNFLGKMLSHMIDNFDYLRFGPGTTAFDEKQVKRIRNMCDHILKSPTGKQGLKKLAEAAGITLYHLSHDIKVKFGLSFLELLYYHKCEQAARLLLSTDKFIPKISAECGFSDPKYLIKHFKLNFKCTPSQFRKIYKADDETLASQVRYEETPLSTAIKYLRRQESVVK